MSWVFVAHFRIPYASKIYCLWKGWSSVSENPMPKLPPSNRFLPNLRYLVLSGTYLGWECITPLAELGTLQVLKLKDDAFSGDSLDVANNGFRSLEDLCINQADLKFWTASKNSYPKLRTLELEKCERLQVVLVELGETLETLSMYRVTRFAISYAKKIQQARAEKGGFKLEIYNGDIWPLEWKMRLVRVTYSVLIWFWEYLLCFHYASLNLPCCS